MEDLFFFFWCSPNFGQKIGLNFSEDFFLYFGQKIGINFNEDLEDLYNFFVTVDLHLILGKKSD